MIISNLSANSIGEREFKNSQIDSRRTMLRTDLYIHAKGMQYYYNAAISSNWVRFAMPTYDVGYRIGRICKLTLVDNPLIPTSRILVLGSTGNPLVRHIYQTIVSLQVQLCCSHPPRDGLYGHNPWQRHRATESCGRLLHTWQVIASFWCFLRRWLEQSDGRHRERSKWRHDDIIPTKASRLLFLLMSRVLLNKTLQMTFAHARTYMIHRHNQTSRGAYLYASQLYKTYFE